MFYPQQTQAPQPPLGPMEPYRQALNQICQQDLYQRSQQSHLRAFHYQLCSERAFDNPAFYEYLQFTARYAYYLCVAQRSQPDAAIMKAAAEVGAMMTAVRAMQYRGQTEHYINQQPPNYKQELNALLQSYEALQVELQRFEQMQQPVQAQSYPMGGMVAQPHMQQGYPAMQAPMQQGYPMPQAMPMQQFQGGGLMSGGGVPVRPLPPAGLGSVPSSRPQPQQQRQHTPRPQIPQFEELSMPPGQSHHFIESQRAPKVEQRTHTAASATSTRKAFPPAPGKATAPPPPAPTPAPAAPVVHQKPMTEKPYVEMDGFKVRPAAGSDWKLTPGGEPTYPLLYDYTTHALLHVTAPNGRVEQVLKERTEDMDYLEHELNPEMRKQYRSVERAASDTKVVPNWGLLRKFQKDPKFRSVEDLNPEVEETEAVLDPSTVSPWIYGPMMANSTDEAIRKIALTRDSERIFADGMPLEYIVRITSPVLTKANHIGLLKDLSRTKTHQELVEHLEAREGKIDADVLDRIDQRLTAGVNDLLRYELGIADLSIDSYIEDYEELSQLLMDEYGEPTSVAFEQLAARLPEQKLTVLTGAQFSEYLSKEDLAGGEDMGSKLLVFLETVVVTRLPWTTDDVTIDLSEGGLVTQEALPNVYGALEAIFTRNKHEQRKYELLMKDGERFSLHKAAFSNNYLIYPYHE